MDDTPDATVRELAAASSSSGPIYLHAISCISDLDHSAQQSKLKSVHVISGCPFVPSVCMPVTLGETLPL